MQKFWLLSLIWISITGIIFGWVRHADAHGEQEAMQLLDTAKPYMSSQNQIIFKYTGNFGTCGGAEEQMLKVGKRLSLAFELPQVEELVDSNSHPTYKVKAEKLPGAVVSLTVASPPGQSACYMVLRLDASAQTEQNDLIKWQENVSKQLGELHIVGEWNVMVQGYLASQTLSGQKNAAELINNLAQDFKGKIVESYTDQNTVSKSLASNEYRTSIQSGNQTVNLQLALHQESTTGRWRLTVGNPIITMEY